ncbi:MAG: hypothetical protein IKA20_06345 [Clostridia bacterium]|nr:hypothetical protein [Clostridia bacterium]
MEKNKYLDNRLAEEFDLIVLVNNTHRDCGFPSGSLGTLTYSYTGRGRPLYGLFTTKNGEKKEQPLRLRDFRVLNEKNRRDCSLIAEYMARLQAESPQNS